jgi:hypothetical protein
MGDVFLGIATINGATFIADQDLLIGMRLHFRPYKGHHEYKRFEKQTIYALTRGCEKVLVAYFKHINRDVRVMLEYTARKKVY